VADIDGKLFNAVTNVGLCPTFEERTLHAETFIMGFSGDLYGKNIRIFFLGFLREEQQFNSPKELILQINVDKNRAIKENGELSWQEIGLN
jgi:riboflavin kinase/FMN adenylyltransferase